MGKMIISTHITDDTGFAERVNSIPKCVASRTLEEPSTGTRR